MLIDGRYIMVGRRDGLFWAKNGNAAPLQAVKCLRTSHFVNEMSVNVEDIRAAVQLRDDMCIPNFIEKCFHFLMLSF